MQEGVTTETHNHYYDDKAKTDASSTIIHAASLDVVGTRSTPSDTPSESYSSSVGGSTSGRFTPSESYSSSSSSSSDGSSSSSSTSEGAGGSRGSDGTSKGKGAAALVGTGAAGSAGLASSRDKDKEKEQEVELGVGDRVEIYAFGDDDDFKKYNGQKGLIMKRDSSMWSAQWAVKLDGKQSETIAFTRGHMSLLARGHIEVGDRVEVRGFDDESELKKYNGKMGEIMKRGKGAWIERWEIKLDSDAPARNSWFGGNGVVGSSTTAPEIVVFDSVHLSLVSKRAEP